MLTISSQLLHIDLYPAIVKAMDNIQIKFKTPLYSWKKAGGDAMIF